MPLEIRELVIKASVEAAASGSGNTASSAGGGTGANATKPEEQLVNLCVEKVLEILKHKAER